MMTQHLRYGGAKFTNNVSPEEINRFVRSLPPQDRESMAKVVAILEREGLITIDQHDISSSDEGFVHLYTDRHTES
ncbi:MAG: hypothetical protein GX489_02670 [Firmicutes bacterium]|nr:hypothetical protein [Bacillota bacterium]